MDINQHRKAIVRALIQGMDRVCYRDSHKLAFTPEDGSVEAVEEHEHPKGCTTCIATGLYFVDELSEKVTTWSNVGPLWMGLWLDTPVYLHDNENTVSRLKLNDGYHDHGNTLFPRWLAEVLRDECGLSISDQDIY